MILLGLQAACLGQEKKQTLDLQGMLEKGELRPVNCMISPLSGETGKKGVHMNDRPGQGIAWLGNGNFGSGTIEFDVRGKDVVQHSFVGIAFHGLNDSTFEVVYLRPFNFRAGDPVRQSHAVQYICVPKHDWDVLRATYPGKYERAIEPAPDPNGWVHVKVVVQGKRIGVYINRHEKPSLVVDQLEDLDSGKIGLWAGNTSGGDWANVTVEGSRN